MAMAMAAAASSFFTGSSLPKKVDVSFSPHLFLTKKIPMQMQQLKIEAASKEKTSRENRIARHIRIRKKLSGTTDRPRLAVFRSSKHLYCQVIDDTKMHTLASASTMQKPLSEEIGLTSGATVDTAKKIGEAIAKACLEKGITKVAFDRGGFVYHGRIKALADAARENGLDF
ncbi:large ribosomal subunit protein uL18c isoform X1 [Cryptomeria japonica]|uniref:large ribosomal subunit protein uL18c isoform X1 n=1 Tax=Cryptomeria japonica TaxID=3369 RepID=UPI0027DA9468|nr:large ribosomal subunit protein uL18c isoform X1 [Cryptomeria japonica]